MTIFEDATELSYICLTCSSSLETVAHSLLSEGYLVSPVNPRCVLSI